MDNDALLKEVIRRLDILISLGIETAGGPEASRPATKIERLSELGLAPSEISAVVGKPLNYVTATLSQRRKRGKRKERTR